MAKGDHVYKSIWIDGNPVTHHGIDCGNGYVIEHQGFFKRISKTPVNQFYSGSTVKVRKYEICDHPDLVVKRAYQAFHDQHHFCQKYDFVNINCESIATWCKTGKPLSSQVKVAKGSANTVGASAAGHLTAKIVQKGAQETLNKSLSPIAKTMIKVGLKDAPKVASVGKAAVGVAGIGGLVSGLATDYIIDQCLEDDHTLSNNERNARNTARTVGKVASTVGAVGGSAAGAMVVGGAGAMVAGAIAAPVVLGLGAAFAAYHLFKD